MMVAIKERFCRLSRKEQLMVAVCGLISLLYIAYFLLWAPLADERKQLQDQREVAQQQLYKVQRLAQEYTTLEGNTITNAGTHKPKSKKMNLSKITDNSAVANGLTIKRYQPSALGGAQVRFENAVFSDMISWFYEIENTHNVSLQDISITKGNDGGLINASVRLSGI